MCSRWSRLSEYRNLELSGLWYVAMMLLLHNNNVENSSSDAVQAHFRCSFGVSRLIRYLCELLGIFCRGCTCSCNLPKLICACATDHGSPRASAIRDRVYVSGTYGSPLGPFRIHNLIVYARPLAWRFARVKLRDL